jgi:hypothetical protein
MKKTVRNQNMPENELKNNESPDKGSVGKSQVKTGKKESFRDPNLGQPQNKGQQYDDSRGIVENGIG